MSAPKAKGPSRFGSFMTPPSETTSERAPAPQRDTTASGVVERPIKHPVTYRIPPRALALVDAAKVAALEDEERKVSKEDLVAEAIERTYGHLIDPD